MNSQTTSQKESPPHHHSNEAENLEAQRAAEEATAISRAALGQLQHDTEKLEHADTLAQQHRYYTDKSARLIRGMTWSGWFQNLVSQDVEPPNYKKHRSKDGGALSWKKQTEDCGHSSSSITRSRNQVSQVLQEEMTQVVEGSSPELVELSEMIKNFKCNVLLLNQCNSAEELDNCRHVCKSLHLATKKAFIKATSSFSDDTTNNLHSNDTIHRQLQFLQKEMEDTEMLLFDTILCNLEQDQQQEQNQVVPQEPASISRTPVANIKHQPPKSQRQAFHPFISTQESPPKQSLLKAYKKQEEHLDSLAKNLDELLHNGAAIGSSINYQNKLLDGLNDDAEDLAEKTALNIRSANRMSHRMMWKKPKNEFKCWVAIQHIETNMYLTIEPHNNYRLVLHAEFHPDASVFGIHEKEQSNFIGFRSKCTQTWLGLSFFGYLICSSKKFGYKEDWVLDDEAMERTQMLNVSANSGLGGWLHFDNGTGDFSIGGHDGAAKRDASQWSVIVLQDDDNR